MNSFHSANSYHHKMPRLLSELVVQFNVHKIIIKNIVIMKLKSRIMECLGFSPRGQSAEFTMLSHVVVLICMQLHQLAIKVVRDGEIQVSLREEVRVTLQCSQYGGSGYLDGACYVGWGPLCRSTGLVRGLGATVVH